MAPGVAAENPIDKPAPKNGVKLMSGNRCKTIITVEATTQEDV